jgi:DNA ligase-1
MKQARRKDNVDASDARLMVFDIIPLSEFKQGRSSLGQRRRLNFLKNFENIFRDSGFIDIVPWREFDLDVLTDEIEYQDYVRELVDAGFEGAMIKDVDAPYVCKRDAAWMKSKPFIEVSLTVTGYEEGTGRNQGRLGALICQGEDDGKTITVNCGSGFSDSGRTELWLGRDSLVGQVVEVRADAVTQNQDGTYSLRFPRFKTFRGFKRGEKL